MKLQIKNGDLQATINSQGAYVEELKLPDKPLFFPKVQFKTGQGLKIRGGMHPCLPNFSRDDLSDLPQHGFGREVDRKLKEQTLASATFTYTAPSTYPAYEGVEFTIKYRIGDLGFYTELEISNEREEAIRIAPAFHPYFYSKDLALEITDYDLDRDKLDDTLFLQKEFVDFKTSQASFRISGQNIHTFAIRTDGNGDYVCVEPTYNGPSFMEDRKDPLILEGKKKFTQSFLIEIL